MASNNGTMSALSAMDEDPALLSFSYVTSFIIIQRLGMSLSGLLQNNTNFTSKTLQSILQLCLIVLKGKVIAMTLVVAVTSAKDISVRHPWNLRLPLVRRGVLQGRLSSLEERDLAIDDSLPPAILPVHMALSRDNDVHVDRVIARLL